MDVVEHERTGLLAKTGDAAALAGAVERGWPNEKIEVELLSHAALGQAVHLGEGLGHHAIEQREDAAHEHLAALLLVGCGNSHRSFVAQTTSAPVTSGTSAPPGNANPAATDL